MLEVLAWQISKDGKQRRKMADYLTNCPNCGAAVDPEADRCAYCETPYPIRLRAELYQIDMQTVAFLVSQVDKGLITPNEARRRLGLQEI